MKKQLLYDKIKQYADEIFPYVYIEENEGYRKDLERRLREIGFKDVSVLRRTGKESGFSEGCIIKDNITGEKVFMKHDASFTVENHSITHEDQGFLYIYASKLLEALKLGTKSFFRLDKRGSVIQIGKDMSYYRNQKNKVSMDVNDNSNEASELYDAFGFTDCKAENYRIIKKVNQSSKIRIIDFLMPFSISSLFNASRFDYMKLFDGINITIDGKILSKEDRMKGNFILASSIEVFEAVYKLVVKDYLDMYNIATSENEINALWNLKPEEVKLMEKAIEKNDKRFLNQYAPRLLDDQNGFQTLTYLSNILSCIRYKHNYIDKITIKIEHGLQLKQKDQEKATSSSNQSSNHEETDLSKSANKIHSLSENAEKHKIQMVSIPNISDTKTPHRITLSKKKSINTSTTPKNTKKITKAHNKFTNDTSSHRKE
jgi:hypothetical protein